MTIDSDAIGEIERLTKAAADTATVAVRNDGSLLVQRVDSDDSLAVIDLERHSMNPRRPRGTTIVHDPDDFATYVRRVAGYDTTVWADQSTRKITAVVNDHTDVAEGLDNPQGWRDHRVVLELQPDPEWEAWLRHDGRWIGQVEMATHLEDYGHLVTEPPSGVLLGVAQTLRATRTAEYDAQPTRLQTGDVAFSFRQTTRAQHGAGQLEVPEWFRVTLSPYIGHDPVDIDARFRFRVNDNSQLELGYQLSRADLVKRAAFDAVRTDVALRLNGDQGTDGPPVFLGAAPEPLSPLAGGVDGTVIRP